MMATKATIAKAIAARTQTAKLLAAKRIQDKAIEDASALIVSTIKFHEFEKIINDTFNPKPKQSQSVESEDEEEPLDGREDEMEIICLPPMNNDCTVETAMYPFKLVLTPQERRQFEASKSHLKTNQQWKSGSQNVILATPQ